jgi:WD40 repeat protein
MKFAVKLLVIVLLIAGRAVICASQERQVRSPDGTTLAVDEGNRTIELRDVSSGVTGPFEEIPQWLRTAQRSTPTVSSISTDGKLLARQRTYGPVILWDVQGRRTLAVFGGTEDVGVRLKFSRDSRFLLSVIQAEARRSKFSRTNGISVWDVRTLKELLHIRESQNTEFNDVALSPDGKMVMALVGTKCTKPISGRDKCVTDTIRLGH